MATVPPLSPPSFSRRAFRELALVVVGMNAFVFYTPEPGVKLSANPNVKELRRFGWAPLVDVPHPRVLLEVLRQRTKVAQRGMRFLTLDPWAASI